MTTPNESNDLPGELSIAEGVKQQRWPHTIDAAVWADEWFKVIVTNPGIASDRASMIGWFANAIMAGYDTARTRRNARLERELAEANLQRDEALVARDFANDAADRRAKERDQWRECARNLYDGWRSNDPHKFSSGAVRQACDEYERLCLPPPTPSSPPAVSESQSEQCPDPCCTDGLVDTGAFTPWGSPIEVNCQHPSHAKPSSPPSSPIAPASSAPESGRVILTTASRLQALERSQELLRRRTDTLMALFSELKMFLDLLPDVRWTWSSKTEWPADLVPTASTSISQPTPKPSGSANESSR